MEELSDCTICLEKIKITEIVTTRCGHWFCKECFWRWTKENNKCPNCREELIERDRAEELAMMKLLDRRREIADDVDTLREEKRVLVRRLKDQRKNIKRKRDMLKDLKKEILENEEIMDEIELWKRNPKLALKKMGERLEEIGKKKEKEQKYNMKFMLKQLQTRVGGGMSKRKICEWHYNRAYPGDKIHGAVIIYNWDYHGCEEKGWNFKDIINLMYPKKRMIKLKRRYMDVKEFYKRIYEKYSWYKDVPLDIDMFGNMFKNDPADEMEEMSDSDVSIAGTILDEEEAELPSSSELVGTEEGIRGIPVLINGSMDVITEQGEIPLEEFMRGNRSIPGLTVQDNGTISYQGYFYNGSPVSEEEYNRLENRDIEDGISEATNELLPNGLAAGTLVVGGVDYSQYIDPEGEDYELGDNYELEDEEIV